MKKIGFLLISIVALAMAACGGGSVKIDPNLSPEEAEAVLKTEKSLPRGAIIESYEVVNATLPLALLESEYKGLRDQAYKARIDYRTNMTRGLQQVAQKNVETLQNIQNTIVEKSASMESNSPKYIFVLANVKEKERKDGNLSGFIAVFDPSTVELVDLVQVTTPLYNNAVMMTEALNGTLINPNQDLDNISSSNTVVNFILNASPK